MVSKTVEIELLMKKSELFSACRRSHLIYLQELDGNMPSTEENLDSMHDPQTKSGL